MDHFSRYMFFGYFVGKPHRRVWRVLFALMGIAVICTLAALYDGLHWLDGERVGLFEDAAFYTSFFANFFLIIYAARLPWLFQQTFKGSAGGFDPVTGVMASINHDSETVRKSYEQQYQKYDDLIARRSPEAVRLYWLLFLFGALANIFVEIGILSLDGTQSWVYQSDHAVTFMAQLLWNVTQWWFIYPEILFLLLSTLWGVLGMVRFIAESRSLVLTPVTVHQRYGLVQITRLINHTMKVLFFPILFVIAFLLVQGYSAEALLGGLFQLTVMFSCFFIPMWKVHTLMKNTRYEQLSDIERDFRALKALYDARRTSSRRKMADADLSERLETAQNIATLTRDLPTWPFNTSILSRPLSVIFLPVFVSFLQLYAERVEIRQSLVAAIEFLRTSLSIHW